MFVVAAQHCPPYCTDRRMVTDLPDHRRIILSTIPPDSRLLNIDRMGFDCGPIILGSLKIHVERQYGFPKPILQLCHCHFCTPTEHDLRTQILSAWSAYDSHNIHDVVSFGSDKQNGFQQPIFYKRSHSRACFLDWKHPTFDD